MLFYIKDKMIFMKKIGIFYGSSTSTTKNVAENIAKQFLNADIYDVCNVAPSKVGEYDILLLGSSTWGDGEIQDDMLDFLSGVSCMNLKDKRIALFGCGDETNEDTFCDAVGEMYNKLQATGATFLGQFNVDGFDFKYSKAVTDNNYAVGLLIDEVNHSELTSKRIEKWCKEIKANI